MSVLGTYEPTILDYLNEDCWKDVLDYVSIREIIRSERVSHGWQRVVLAYLRRITFCIEHSGRPRYPDGKRLHKIAKFELNHAQRSSFESWTNKLGPSVVGTYCASEESLKTIGENCPNLETVMFFGLHGKLLLTNQYENFKWLQRVCFNTCPSVSDRCVSHLTANNVIEELEFHCNDQVTGKFLMKINSENLKALVFNRCEALDFRYLWSAVHRLSQLTKFELKLAPLAVYRKIHLLLDKMLKLEHLELCHPMFGFAGFGLVFESVCRLSSLRHLGGSVVTSDENLEVVVRCCKELQSLELQGGGMLTGRGLAAACAQAGPRLTALGAHYFSLNGDDVVACVRACPNLEKLDVRLSVLLMLTQSFLHRASAARLGGGRGRGRDGVGAGGRGRGGGGGLRARRPLHVYMDRTDELQLQGGPLYDRYMREYEGLIIHQ